MNAQVPHSADVADVNHRGWRLQASWLRSFCGADDGWVCYATAPAAFHKLNIGRWGSSDLALEHGRAYVDRKMDAPVQATAKLTVQKRRQ